jgi:hypothetical protein
MRRLGTVAVTTIVMVAVAAAAAYAGSLTVTTQRLGGAPLNTPIMFPRSFATTNGGNRAGQIQNKDTVTWTWSVPIDQTTLCSGWSNAQITHSFSMTWVISDNAGSTGNDLLVAGSTGVTCSTGMHIGSVDLGAPGYISGGNGTIAGATTAIVVIGGTTTLQVTVPATPTGGSASQVSSGSAAVWTPDPAVTDLAGRSCGSCLAKSTTTVQF